MHDLILAYSVRCGHGCAGRVFLRVGGAQNFIDGGTDFLEGGDETDTFRFYFGEGKDVIFDFENNTDLIEFDNFGISKADAFTFVKTSGDDVIFDFGEGGMLVVEDVTIGQLRNDVFMAH